MTAILRCALIFLLYLTACTSQSANSGPAENPEYDNSLRASKALHRNNTKWWKKRFSNSIKVVKEKKFELLMIGDSITHGWEGQGRETWKKYYKNRKAHNMGYSGDQTQHVIWRLQNGEVAGQNPRLAVVMIGTNNTGRRETSENTAYGVLGILKELRVRLPQTKILVLAIFPRDHKPNSKMRKLNEEANKIIKTFADDKHVFYLDINEKFLDDQGNLPKSIMNDALHPTASGYKIWAEAMEASIQKLFGER